MMTNWILLILVAVVSVLTACGPTNAEAHGAGIPMKALQYRRVLRGEMNRVWGWNVSADVIAAQFQKESAWDETAVSWAGAKGLGQFMSATALGVAKLYQNEGLWPPNALSASWAIKATVRHDRDNWLKYPEAATPDDRHGFMLAAYNMGPTWVSRERKATAEDGGDRTRWFSHVEDSCVRKASACKETKDYADVILNRFRKLYRGW